MRSGECGVRSEFLTQHSAFRTLHSTGGAPLIPKLRGYFAEFLREVSLARLGLLDPPTCVGLRYGRPGEQQAAFLGRLSGDTLRPKAQLSIRLPNPFSLCVTCPVLTLAGAGLLTCWASTTPYGLALAPD